MMYYEYVAYRVGEDERNACKDKDGKKVAKGLGVEQAGPAPVAYSNNRVQLPHSGRSPPKSQ